MSWGSVDPVRPGRSGSRFLAGCSMNSNFVYKPNPPPAATPKLPVKVAVLPFEDGTENFTLRGSVLGAGQYNLAKAGVGGTITAMPPEFWGRDPSPTTSRLRARSGRSGSFTEPRSFVTKTSSSTAPCTRSFSRPRSITRMNSSSPSGPREGPMERSSGRNGSARSGRPPRASIPVAVSISSAFDRQVARRLERVDGRPDGGSAGGPHRDAGGPFREAAAPDKAPPGRVRRRGRRRTGGADDREDPQGEVIRWIRGCPIVKFRRTATGAVSRPGAPGSRSVRFESLSS